MRLIPENTEVSVRNLGGKAFNLDRLCAIGCEVPEFIVLSSEVFTGFLGDSLDEYRSLLSDYSEGSRLRILDIIKNCSFSEDTVEKITEAVSETFGDLPVSVRSSAVDEDSEEHSFAGMMESFLNVSGKDEILDSVKKCYLSCFSERIMKYRENSSLISPDITAAVIIQKMINADYSGVIFTSNPVTNDPDEIFISVVAGAGEQLVSGSTDSCDYIMNRNGKLTGQNGSTVSLSPELLDGLYRAAVHIENGFRPARGQDIEFCTENGKIHILQCRLITGFRHINKELPRTVLDNSNIIESYSGVTTPLTFTFARDVYSKIYRQTLRSFYISEEAIESVSDDLDNMLHFYENRVYYRLNSWYRMTSLYPGYEKNRQYMENMMGVKAALDESPVQAKSRLFRIYAGFIRRMINMKRDSRRFLERFEKVTAPYYADSLEGFSSRDALAVYEKLEHEILDDFITPIANDMGAMVIYGKLTETLQKAGIDGYEGLVSAAVGKQGNVESAQQSEALINIVRMIASDEETVKLFCSPDDEIKKHMDDDTPVFRAVREYIYRFGPRTMDELKLETVTLAEDPSFLFQTVRGYLKCDSLPELKSGDSDDSDRALLSHFHGPVRLWVHLLLVLTKYFIRNRESLRLRRTYIYSIIRNVYLRIGSNFASEGIINTQRDIFFMTRDEIAEVVKNGNADPELIRNKIRTRRAEYETNRGRVTNERMYFYGEVCPENMIPVYSRQETEGSSILRGTAGGGGTAEGKVRLVEDPSGADVSGLILMAKRTDPGWTVLFPMAKAVIIERGSVLSHSAVVAREMGIPLVAGIRGLTDNIKDGMTVRVDGINGTVEILGEENG